MPPPKRKYLTLKKMTPLVFQGGIFIAGKINFGICDFFAYIGK